MLAHSSLIFLVLGLEEMILVTCLPTGSSSFPSNLHPPTETRDMEVVPSPASSSSSHQSLQSMNDYNDQQQVDGDAPLGTSSSQDRMPIFQRDPMSQMMSDSDQSPPSMSASGSSRDMEAAPSHHHGHHGGGDHHGWLDMGAYSGKKGAFGWYADFPVGGKHYWGK